MEINGGKDLDYFTVSLTCERKESREYLEKTEGNFFCFHHQVFVGVFVRKIKEPRETVQVSVRQDILSDGLENNG